MVMLSYSSSRRCGRGGGGLLLLLGLFRVAILVVVSADENNENKILLQFGDQLRCPYAEKWLTKGPKQAAIDLGLEPDLYAAHEAAHASAVLDQVAAVSSLRGGAEAAAGDADARRQLQEEGGAWPTTATTNGETTCAIAVGPAGAAHQASYASGYRSDCPGTPAESSPYMWPLKWQADVYSQSMPFGSDHVIYESKSRVWYALDKNYKRSDTYYTRGVQRSVGQGPCPPGNLVDDPNNALLACRRDSTQRRTMLHRGSKMYFINWKENNTTTTTTTNTTNSTSSTTVPAADPLIDNVSQIVDCTWLDLAIVGNIRPDWFLDNRGDDTDVQYLGNQHVYTYAVQDITSTSDNDDNSATTTMTTPRLVKQWRKKDFASQYFTMSMLANPYNSSNTNDTSLQAENNFHWPIVLNVPGEGFGDDFLQSYSNHRILTSDEDDVIFLLDEAFVAAGGSCPQQVIDFGGEGGGSGPPSFVNTTSTNTTTSNTTSGDNNNNAFGPPSIETAIPSNLEVDENSWFTNVYTYSPVWQPPPKTDDTGTNGGNATNDPAAGMATTVAGLATISSCYDESKSAVYLKFAFDNVVTDLALEPLPWLALSYRKDETCYMTPIDGSDGELIFLQHNETTGESLVSIGYLQSALRSSSPEALASVYDSLVPLDQVPNGRFSDVALTVNDDDAAIALMTTTTTTSSASSSSMVELEFYEQMPEAPTVMYMNYAIGMSPELGYHKNRLCFEITSFPSCAAAGEATENDTGDDAATEEATGTSSSSNTVMHTATIATVSLSVAWALFSIMISS